MESLLYHIDGKRQDKERYIPNPAFRCVYPHVHLYFQAFRLTLVTEVDSRPSDNDMVGNEIP